MTNFSSPSPGQYFDNSHRAKGKNDLLMKKLAKSTSKTVLDQSSNFKSQVIREPGLETVPKSIISNPGPGQYDLTVGDNIKNLNFQLNSRYHLKPFGSGQGRFEDIQNRMRNKKSTLDYGQVVEVEDTNMKERREAFRQTLNIHRKYC